MSRLEIKQEINSDNWHINEFDLQSEYVDVFIGFLNHDNGFDNLRFGIEVRTEDNLIKKTAFPGINVSLKSSDQEFLQSLRIKWNPNTEYTFNVWASNQGTIKEKQFKITSPIPVQPFSSWTWNGNEWKAPVDKPNDGEEYEWNNESQEWEIIPRYSVE